MSHHSGPATGAAASGPTAAILTASDGCAAGVVPDRSGVIARRVLLELGFRIADSAIVPDEVDAIRERVGAWAASGIQLVLTTGGTGLGPRDRTPEAVLPLLDRELPGYGELLRSEGLRDTPMAVLSRSLAGSIGATLVIVLPGSPRAVESGLRTLAPTIPHALQLLAGDTAHSRSVRARND
ncbi:MAG: MogA/MoaB family molybdenum cofactor biosynthesis protein [Acidobacteriota bacterium]|nr:MogA/MoaB family molybdenum cofactor biosynthesis protein [Acidobacteriota bacterium]